MRIQDDLLKAPFPPTLEESMCELLSLTTGKGSYFIVQWTQEGDFPEEH
jgi:hypothetical protein